MPFDCMISLYKLAFILLLMTQCAQAVSNIAVYGSAMHSCVLIHGLTDKSDTVVEFDSDRCFFSIVAA